MLLGSRHVFNTLCVGGLCSPLRSRFQARAVQPLPLPAKVTALRTAFPHIPTPVLVSLVSFRETLRLIENESASSGSGLSAGSANKLLHFSESGLEHVAALLDALYAGAQTHNAADSKAVVKAGACVRT